MQIRNTLKGSQLYENYGERWQKIELDADVKTFYGKQIFFRTVEGIFFGRVNLGLCFTTVIKTLSTNFNLLLSLNKFNFILL